MFEKCKTAFLFNDSPAHTVDSNFYKHAGADIDGSILVLRKGKKTLITSQLNFSEAKKLCNFSVKLYPKGKIAPFLKKFAPAGSIGLDFESISAARLLRLKKIFGKRIVDISSTLAWQRVQKTPDEIEKIKKAAKISRKILSSLHLSSKESEIDVANRLKIECLKAGAALAYPPIVASGKNSSNPHHSPTKKKLGNGIVLIDFGVKYENYCSDLTRCFFLGACKKEKQKYSEAKQIFFEMLHSMHRFRTCAAVAKYSQSCMKKAGWPAPVHAIGHGIGLDIHEHPYFYAKTKKRLLPNSIFAIEPGCYLSNFGVRYEDDILLTRKKAKLI